MLELKLGRLLGKNSELLSRIDVKALDELATEAFEAKYPEVEYVENDRIAALIRHVSDKTDGHSFSENFLIS